MIKNGKRFTVAERNYLDSLKLQSQNWLLCKKKSDEWHLVHRLTGTSKIIPAP